MNCAVNMPKYYMVVKPQKHMPLVLPSPAFPAFRPSLPRSLQQLVYEKEKRLRMMMKMHGLGDGAYWLITYCWWVTENA